MAWTTPRTWVTGELITATLMNAHIRDNLSALKDPPTDEAVRTGVADYTTTSTSFVDVDATNLALTITTAGGDVMVGMTGTLTNTDATYMTFFDVDVDGTREGGVNGITHGHGTSPKPVGFVWMVRGLSAGTHTFKLQWRVNGGTGYLYAHDSTIQFWAREVS